MNQFIHLSASWQDGNHSLVFCSIFIQLTFVFWDEWFEPQHNILWKILLQVQHIALMFKSADCANPAKCQPSRQCQHTQTWQTLDKHLSPHHSIWSLVFTPISGCEHSYPTSHSIWHSVRLHSLAPNPLSRTKLYQMLCWNAIRIWPRLHKNSRLYKVWSPR